ncbi:hypothetical protein FKP32DRAFT_1586247 [Trametes sanguinea]|nr:hypothetical protein FKP32DRAFT_1586247 [Trametes sanguinea]
MADVLVPAEITGEVTQILSNLVLGDNLIRSAAEKAVNDRLEQTPDLYILAIAQFATSADSELMRSFSLVLLRRLLFRPLSTQRLALYDQLPAPVINTLERILLHSLLHEPAPVVRHKSVDTVTDLSNYAMKRGRPWHALQSQSFAMADSADVHTREAAFRVFAGCPNLIMDLQTDAIISILQKGLQDQQSTEVSYFVSIFILSRHISSFRSCAIPGSIISRSVPRMCTPRPTCSHSYSAIVGQSSFLTRCGLRAYLRLPRSCAQHHTVALCHSALAPEALAVCAADLRSMSRVFPFKL